MLYKKFQPSDRLAKCISVDIYKLIKVLITSVSSSLSTSIGSLLHTVTAGKDDKAIIYSAPWDASESTSGAFQVNVVDTFGLLSFFDPGTMLEG